jgi:phosphate transport system substrate-binding protein
MQSLLKKSRFASLALLSLVVLSSVGLPASRTSAIPECPVVVKVEGSTTVFPITQAAEAPFEAAWPGTDAQLASIGSGNGLNKLLAGQIEVAPSSRPLKPNELAVAYDFEIGRDGFVIAVQNSLAMDFINNITKTQVEQIYEGVLHFWDEGGLGGPHIAIVPRARITGSGSQPDFLASFAVDSTLENNTIAATGLARLVESSDMAQQAAANVYQIAYTSLANLDTPGMKALTLNGIAATPATVLGGTYPAPRELHLAVNKTAVVNRIDSTKHVRGDDWVNFELSNTGQTLVEAAGFVKVPVPATPPIPDWDINMDGNTSLGDLGAITAKWGQSAACPGWIRADANNSGGVSLGDIGTITGKWGNPGFIPPN